MDRLMLTDGTKSISLDQYPNEAWTWLAGKPQDKASPEQYFAAVPWLYRGTTLRADALSSMPFALYKGETEYDRSDAWQNKVGFLPDPTTLLWLVEACLTLEPMAYLFSDNAGAYRKRLRYIIPSGVTPKTDPVIGVTAFERYVNNVKRTFKPGQDIIYFWRPDPYVEQYTQPGNSSPGKAALMASGVIANIDEFIAGFFKRGAIKVTLFVADGIGETDANKFESWWKDFMTGIRNAWRTKVLRAKAMTPVVVGEGLEGLKDNNLTAQKREDISTALGVPQTKLFSGSASGLGGGGVVSQDDIRFYKETIIPECKFVAGILNEQVFTPLGLTLRFLPETLEIFQEDEAERANSINAFMDALGKMPTYEIAVAVLATFGFEMSPDFDKAIKAYFAKKEEQAAQMAQTLTGGEQPGDSQEEQPDESDEQDEAKTAALVDLEKWERKALKALKAGKAAAVPFESANIPQEVQKRIHLRLTRCETPEAVKDVFRQDWNFKPEPVDGYFVLAAELKRANDLLEATA